jgi:hypothetical protein
MPLRRLIATVCERDQGESDELARGHVLRNEASILEGSELDPVIDGIADGFD